MAYLVPGDICDLHVFLLDHMDHSLGTLAPSLIVDFPRPVVLEMLDRPAIARGLLLSTMSTRGRCANGWSISDSGRRCRG